MVRNRSVALLAGASLAVLCLWSSDGFARGGGHFGGGHFGGGHFGGGHFGGRGRFDRGFRPEMRERFDREIRRPEGEHRSERERRRDDANRQLRDRAEDRRNAAGREAGARRDLANRDLHRPANVGHWDQNRFWNKTFGARTFNCYNCRWGWAGAVFWPFAIGDIFSYAWWPYDGTPAFWNYGLNYIVTGLFWPYGAYAWPEGYGAYAWSGDSSSYQYARESHQNVYSAGPADGGAEAQAAEAAELAQSCGGFAPGVGALPVDRIEQAVKPTGNQRKAFDDLKAASAQAETILKGSCPSEPPLTPVGRLDALQKRLEAMDQAVDTLEEPLETFSKALSPEQRKALDGLATASGNPDTKRRNIGRCLNEGQEFVDLPAQEIAQSVQPDAKQSAALEKLELVTGKAAEKLRSQCPPRIPKTAEGRLEAMDSRLHETIVAVNEVRPALAGFYDSLSDEQKARFDTLPREPVAKQR
jgi:hypothetical protein